MFPREGRSHVASLHTPTTRARLELVHGGLGQSDVRRSTGKSASSPSVACHAHLFRNRLLQALAPDELDRIRPNLEMLRVRTPQVLFEPDEPIRYVYFPETAVVSLATRLRRATTIEVGTVGCEGFAGLPSFLSDEPGAILAKVQLSGVTARMDIDAFTLHTRSTTSFHGWLLRYTQAFLTQVGQTAACNSAHLVEERCARWLLMTHDRVVDDQFELPREQLAAMLGIRKEGVTFALRGLEETGSIGYSRNTITIVDRQRLEDTACECYRVVRGHFDRLLPSNCAPSHT